MSPEVDLAALVEAFCDARPRLATRKGSFDRCRDVSADLAAFLGAHGFAAEVVRLSEGRVDMPRADPRWQGLRSRFASSPSFHWTHYVVLVEGTIVDAAARQLDPSCPHPLIRTIGETLEDWGVARRWDPAVGWPIGEPLTPAEEDSLRRAP